MKAAVGGTFNVLHAGHKALLSRAFSIADEVVIGLVSDDMAKRSRGEVNLFDSRRQALEEFVKGLSKRYSIVEINDEFGTAAEDGSLDIIVASENSQKNAEAINAERKRKGLKELEIEVVSTVIAEDFRPISSTRVIAKEIDSDGKLLRALKVRVGTSNPVKVEAVRRVLSRLYRNIEIEGINVESGVPQQPKEEEVLRGAINRAKAAVGEADLGIGVEAGLIWDETVKWYFDVQYCVIVDSMGSLTIGHGPGFWYPPQVIDVVEKGMTVNEAMQIMTGMESIGHKMGAVGFLSKQFIDRTSLTEWAVITAMIPRMRPELYSKLWRKI